MTQTCNQANTSETRRRLSATFPIFLEDCDDDDDGGGVDVYGKNG